MRRRLTNMLSQEIESGRGNAIQEDMRRISMRGRGRLLSIFTLGVRALREG
jgi:hypothetical protein